MNQVERWEQELKAAGWRPWEKHPRAVFWYAPNGQVHPGPGWAWQVMKNGNLSNKETNTL